MDNSVPHTSLPERVGPLGAGVARARVRRSPATPSESKLAQLGPTRELSASLGGPIHSPSCFGPSLFALSTNHVSTRRMTRTGEMMPARSQMLSTSSAIQ